MRLLNFFSRSHYQLFKKQYSIHPKAGRSGIRMATSRTLFESGFRMVKNKMAAKFGGHFVKIIRKLDFFPAFEWSDHLKAGPKFFNF